MSMAGHLGGRRRRRPRGGLGSSPPPTATPPPLLRLLLAAAILAAGLTPATAQSTPTTVLKPNAVRFIRKRATSELPSLAAAAAATTARLGAGGEGGTSLEAIGGLLLPDVAERDARARAAAEEYMAAALGNASSSSSLAAGMATTTTTTADVSLARLRARTAAAAAAAAATAGPAGPLAASASRSRPSVAATATATVRRAWRAINAYEASTAVGNPDALVFEPPDQGLAVGNGYVLASNNNLIRAYDAKTGAPLSPPVDLTVLLALPPYRPLHPTPDGCGDRVVDPSTLYDPETRRFFQTMARMELDPDDCTQTGRYFIDVAVSATASPLGRWVVYSIYSANDGRDGSPLVAGCETGCFADFPRASIDPNLLVITANSFLESTGEFKAANLYALDKYALARGAEKVALAEFNLLSAGDWDGGEQIFSVSPAYVPPRKNLYQPRKANPITGSISSNKNDNNNLVGGAEEDDGSAEAAAAADVPAAAATTTATARAGHSGGSKAPPFSHYHKQHHKKNKNGPRPLPPYNEPFLLLARSLSDNQRLIRFALTGTRALKKATAQRGLDALMTALTLTLSPVALVETVTNPSQLTAFQPFVGNFPYGQLLGYPFPGLIGGSDGRVLSSVFAAGKHLGVFSVWAPQEVSGQLINYFSIYLVQLDAKTGALLQTDILSEAQEDLGWPAVALDRYGKGAVVSTASSFERYPSLAVYPIASDGTVGARQIVFEGKGLQDGFTQYGGRRPRFGDYSALVVEAETGDFWGAGEYISVMSCPVSAYISDRTCGGTRSQLSNWDTGVFALAL